MNKNDFVPILAEVNKVPTTWYYDVSSLGIEELMNLKKELSGTREDSIRLLDKIIYSKVNANCGLYDTSDSRYRKDKKRRNKELVKKMKFGGKKKW